MPSAHHAAPSSARGRAVLPAAGLTAAVVALGALAGLTRGDATDHSGRAAGAVPPAAVTPSATAPAVAAAPGTRRAVADPPDGLPTITYLKGPRGLPADPDPHTLTTPAEAVRLTRRMVLYDAPGGRARAYLPPRISGLPVVAPIVARQNGWVAVLAPTANRRIGWLPDRGWRPEPLRDHLIVDLSSRRLTWTRDGVQRQSWQVSVGSSATPTPSGRTFVLGRTGTEGTVYAGLDALVLASVPERPENLSSALRKAHTGIHAWSRRGAFGRGISNGCVRMPAKAQRTLLKQITPGTPVTVVA
ncbi:L,D-transpeptidase [Actinoplanes sp. NBRC 101535]|uniref:L,D-transpeptidase n=1 Tax=Actinoplanes sp. NBRC 101535 TaxID=3032196 RepID=UPI00249FE422|nr:L,D-transpeptidase [Actinoplanes sp. NBRC 101535]GLY04182.1 hypothetical protein Acsp01_45610 [Actinoplanes sp. NBRC 101535]